MRNHTMMGPDVREVYLGKRRRMRTWRRGRDRQEQSQEGRKGETEDRKRESEPSHPHLPGGRYSGR